jgi:hypothetical protein
MFMGKMNYWILFALLQMSTYVWAEQAIDNVIVVALSPLDKTAVVRLPNQVMQVLKTGDSIQGTELKLTRVLTNKLVFEQMPEPSSSNRTGRIVWLHRAVNGISEVEYLDTPK